MVGICSVILYAVCVLGSFFFFFFFLMCLLDIQCPVHVTGKEKKTHTKKRKDHLPAD